jgi:hypothetical protein
MPAPYSRHGIRTETVDHFLVDAGAVYVNLGETDERLLGATRGGNSFAIEQDVREPEIDGSPGPLKGTRRIVETRPTLTANLLEITRENIMMAIAGAEAEAYPDDTAATHDEIRRRRNITAADYVKNIALVGTINGSDEPVIFIIYNALQTDNFELGTEDRDEGVLTLTLTGHFDPADMSVEPWAIRYPRQTGLQSGGTTA